jgi:GntR family transcriptional regulator
MPRKQRWEEILAVLRNRILSGELKPGQEFPTNMELAREFDAYPGTIHAAVKALIQEGLVLSHGRGRHRRIVRPLPERSSRRGGFLTEFEGRALLEVLAITELNTEDLLPKGARGPVQVPALRYYTRQWRDNIPVAISDSYLPGTLPVDALRNILADPAQDLYAALRSLGHRPDVCEETLIARMPTPAEADMLHLPAGANIPVVNIKRLVFDSEGQLLEFCLLIDRADCYEFVYRFPFD